MVKLGESQKLAVIRSERCLDCLTSCVAVETKGKCHLA